MFSTKNEKVNDLQNEKQPLPVATDLMLKRAKTIKMIYTYLSIIIAGLSVLWTVYSSVIISIFTKRINALEGREIPVSGGFAPVVAGILAILLCWWGYRVLKSAAKKNSTGRFIAALFIDFIPFVLGLNLFGKSLRWIGILLYIVIFVVMINLNKKNKKEYKEIQNSENCVQ